MDQWVNDLRVAIVEQAMKDYKEHMEKREYRQARSLERWFRSEWGEMLSGDLGKVIVKHLKKECPYEL